MINGDKLPSSCLLCSGGELNRLGHIIPKFVMRFLKSASNKSGFFLNNTKEKVSDTLAMKMLCDKCEEIFSEHEKFFTDKYFKTYYRKKPRVAINNDIYFFTLSVAWRILASTPIMKGEEGSSNYFRGLTKDIGSYLLNPNKAAEIDVYIFHADDIVANLPEESYNPNILKFSVRQGIFAEYLNRSIGSYVFRATPAPIPLVYFKLGVYYFMVTYQNYLQSLSFIEGIEKSGGGRVHVLGYSIELIGFLHHISNDIFFEVDGSIIPRGVEYNRIRS
ncbi:MAG: hypothetical protein J0H52_11280 [Comamonadaceae bacterium]|nr:hypothetical protein [Comamonadaceae bacterium]